MPSKREQRKNPQRAEKLFERSRLRRGDMVMVIAGGNEEKRPNKGKVGRIVRFVGKEGERVIVEGLNMFVRHKRQSAPGKPSGRIKQEGGIHLSNLMYYVEKIKCPVRLRARFLDDGRKVRGYLDKESGEFVQV